MTTQLKFICKSKKYKSVNLYIQKDGKERWRVERCRNGAYYDTEREAAIEVDKKLIEKGKKPVNILIPKICQDA